MKPWLHLAAAVVGLLCSALVVVLVFGAADREGSSQEGQAPGQEDNSRARESCGSVPAKSAFTKAHVTRARAHLPDILNAQGAEVQVPANQVEWFARVHAALGLCTEEVSMFPRQVSASARFPATTSKAELERYAYNYLQASFSRPLARSVSELVIVRGSTTRRVLIVSPVWSTFQRTHRRLGLPPSIAGLKRLKTQAGYGNKLLLLQGW